MRKELLLEKIKDIEFVECYDCSNKSGSPQLCNSCLLNREAISKLKSMIKNYFEESKPAVREQANKIFYLDLTYLIYEGMDITAKVSINIERIESIKEDNDDSRSIIKTMSGETYLVMHSHKAIMDLIKNFKLYYNK